MHNKQNTTKPQRHIVLSEENFTAIQNQGRLGQTFDEVMTEILKKAGLRS